MYNNKIERKLKELDEDFLKIQLDKNNNGLVMVHCWEHGSIDKIKDGKVQSEFTRNVFDVDSAIEIAIDRRDSLNTVSDDFVCTFFISLKKDKNTMLGHTYKAGSIITIDEKLLK